MEGVVLKSFMEILLLHLRNMAVFAKVEDVGFANLLNTFAHGNLVVYDMRCSNYLGGKRILP